MDAWRTFFGPNAGYAQELYERYLQDPASVDAATRAFFERVSPPPEVAIATAPALSPSPPQGEGRQTARSTVEGITDDEIRLAVGTAKLARMIRTYGHLAARLDPLETPPLGNPALAPSAHGLTEDDLANLPATIVWPASMIWPASSTPWRSDSKPRVWL